MKSPYLWLSTEQAQFAHVLDWSEVMIFDPSLLEDGRGIYPDRITANVPRGFRERVRRASRAEQTTSAEFIRRAISERAEKILDEVKA